ncbi:SMI1/KNR4 family protein [Metabacillus indicus]|uniref:Cell wall assembly protein n=1 Tax=Metabacillus indicus TaxID=246786 RepID=A0A084H243_METID|nr:SMI1/KNR4 family protein [Metabacillus indicus]KEZ53655.1 cell wall assembly protein [Metabacillus indicus]
MKIKQNTIVKPLPTDELIKEHEKFWRLKLPESFLTFIKENNGAEIENGTFEYNNRCYAIERFLCMLDDIEDHPNGIYDIDAVFTQIGERLTNNEDLLGTEILPVASIFAGDFVCLDYRTDMHNPSVCIWSHEESGDFDPVTYKAADSFSEFLKILQ